MAQAGGKESSPEAGTGHHVIKYRAVGMERGRLERCLISRRCHVITAWLWGGDMGERMAETGIQESGFSSWQTFVAMGTLEGGLVGLGETMGSAPRYTDSYTDKNFQGTLVHSVTFTIPTDTSI